MKNGIINKKSETQSTEVKNAYRIFLNNNSVIALCEDKLYFPDLFFINKDSGKIGSLTSYSLGKLKNFNLYFKI